MDKYDALSQLLRVFNEGKYEDCVRQAKLFCEKNDTDGDAWKILGAALQKCKQPDQGLAAMQKAAKLLPNDPEVFNNLGVVLRETGRLDDSVKALEKSISLRPDFAQAYSNLASTLNDLGLSKAAELSARKAIALNPGYAKAYNNLGSAIKAQGKIVEAIHIYTRGIQLNGDFAEAYSNLGEAYKDIGSYTEAEACYKKALEKKVNFPVAFSNYLFSLNYRDDFAPQRAYNMAQSYGELVSSQSSFIYKNWTGNDERADTRVRIGFVSGDLRTHPVAYFLVSLLDYIDRTAFALIAFQSGPRQDAITEKLREKFDEWVVIYGESDSAAAQIIHSKSVDILIDLAGHTAYNRLPVFAYRPSPIQLSWLGYFATTGVPQIDYLIADAVVLPKSDEKYYTESIIRLGGPYFCFTPLDIDFKVEELPALRNGYITFGCFNNLSKLNLRVLGVWAEILKAMPASKIFLKCKQLSDEQVSRSIVSRFKALGIEDSRIITEGQTSRRDYFHCYNRVDIALDPFPFPGGTTSIEGLWMGVPVVTLEGDRYIGRNGETIAYHIGHSEWIAKSPKEYVSIACGWATKINELASLRAGLRSKILKSRLFDAAEFTYDFSKKLLELMQKAPS